MQRLRKQVIQIVILIVGVGTIFLLDRSLSERWQASREFEEARMVAQLEGSIRLAMEGKIAAMLALAGWYEHSEQTSKEKLRQFVAIATQGEPSFKFVMYADDNLIIRGCSPPQPDLNILEYDLKDEDYTHSLAQEAERRKTVLLSRPWTLPNGGMCFFVMVPIMMEERMQGLVIGVFDQARAVAEIVPPEVTEAYNVSIRDTEGNQIAGKDTPELRIKKHYRVRFRNSESNWFFAIQPKQAPSNEFLYYRLPIWGLGFLLLAFLSAYIYAMYHQREELERLVAERTEELQTAYETLEKVAITDPLTELFNRRFFYQRFSEELSRAKRNKTPLSCLLLDLDNFKQVNDRHGHLLGDQVLVETANILRRNTRKEDVPARYGGEEFILLLTATNKDRAMAVGERIRKDIDDRWFDRFANDPTPLRLTASIGVTEFVPDDHNSIATDDIIQQADTALYKAKRTGKNRVAAYSPEDAGEPGRGTQD
ncbi:MAG: GGDEF domain-containing protein [Planctomycetes bacterium]|nr:GGDEF domain-containing protein [Planctomycetota bacterium]